MAIDLSSGSANFPRALEVRQKLYDSGSAGVSTRFRRLDRLEAFYRCMEYDHLETDWTGRPADQFETISHAVVVPRGFVQPAEKSVLEKRPTAPMRLCPMIVDRFTGLLFGRGRVPELFVEDDPDSDDFLRTVFRECHFWRTMRQGRSFGGAMGSVLILVHLKEGKFFYRAHNPKTVADIVWADEDSRIPAGVLIQYIYPKEIEVLDSKSGQPSGSTRMVPYLYRRIIDQEMDISFVPIEIRPGENLPEMVIDEHTSVRHGLGRFPGAWIQNLPDDLEMDGVADCAGAYQTFDAIDRILAQANKALIANMDPTLVITRDPKLEQKGVPIRKGSENALNVGLGGGANYLEMGGGSITAALSFMETLRQAALDKTGMVAPDPERLSGAAQSAKAIEYLYAPTLEKADQLREQYGEGLVELATITLMLAREFSNPDHYEGNALPLFELPPKIVERKEDPSDPDSASLRTFLPRVPGNGRVVSVRWGNYFQPTPSDIQTAVLTVTSLMAASLMDVETAARRIAPLFDIDDVDAFIRRIKEESEKKKDAYGGGAFGGGGGGGGGGFFPKPKFVPEVPGAAPGQPPQGETAEE